MGTVYVAVGFGVPNPDSVTESLSGNANRPLLKKSGSYGTTANVIDIEDERTRLPVY